nr:uncharacterized protein LOC109184147 [Ipomoea trifida]
MSVWKNRNIVLQALHEPLDKLRVLWNDASVLDLTELAIRFKSCDIYVDHGIDEAGLIPCYLLPRYEGNVEGDEGNHDVNVEVNEETSDNDCTVGDEGSDEDSDEDSDEGYENHEGDEDSDSSAEEYNGYSDFENDIGGVT